MMKSIARQYEQNQRRRVERAAATGNNALHELGGEAHKAPDTFRPRSHGYRGAHNRNTKATSGARQRAYPAKSTLFTTGYEPTGRNRVRLRALRGGK